METVLVYLDEIKILEERSIIEDLLELFFCTLEFLIRTFCDPVVHPVRIDFGSSENSSFFERIFSICFRVSGEHRDAQVKTCGNRDK